MGHGDMNMFSMAGTWLGISAMPSVFLYFCVIFALMYLFMKSIEFKLSVAFPSGYIPLGIPHLVASIVWIPGFRIV